MRVCLLSVFPRLEDPFRHFIFIECRDSFQLFLIEEMTGRLLNDFKTGPEVLVIRMKNGLGAVGEFLAFCLGLLFPRGLDEILN